MRWALNKLNSNKSPGYDGLTKEHLKAVGEPMVDFLAVILSHILESEYMPVNFRRGTQIPLYKGKNTSTLDPNNFRGITLLSTFNKVFEILLWSRVEQWWNSSQAVSDTQGACRKGVSSLHTALLLQETIATNLEAGKRIFVAYLDVSKAFDRVFIEGLFYQLRQIGIVGKTWRLLYGCYKGFLCRVRICDRYSEWYEMSCGIHQGGYLSLIKYIAFINSLLIELKDSKLCCKIYRTPSSPLGYADNIAAASTSKHHVDQILNIVHTHSSKWRYDLNAKKSAVVVYGETLRENKNNMTFRNYLLGSEKVPEKVCYDHVGVKTCNGLVYTERTQEKISKSRKALSAASALGIKRGGISIRACNIIYCCLIVPILTYGAELWVLKQSDVEALDKFQRYAGRRIQRFPSSSPNETSFRGLGWMRLENYINAKKLIFIRTILIRKDDCIFKQVFKERANVFNENINECIQNHYDSPIFDMLRVALIFDIYDSVMNMTFRNHSYSKQQWKSKVWSRAWEIEDCDWRYGTLFHTSMEKINLTIGSTYYLAWWQISDIFPQLMRQCETLSKLVCRASDLKSDDYRYSNVSYNTKSCSLCDLAAYECVDHLIMTCPYNHEIRTDMFKELENNPDCREVWRIVTPQATLKVLLGGKCENCDFNDMIPIWCTAASWIHMMYHNTIKNRTGIG